MTRTRWAAIGAAIAVSLGGGVVMVANAAYTSESEFVAITPCRLLDTRSDVDPVSTSKVENLGIRRGVLKNKNEGGTVNNDIVVIFDAAAADNTDDDFTLQVNSAYRPILGKCDAQFGGSGDLVGVTPTALLLNVTTVGSTANGFVTVYPWQKLCTTASGTCTPTTGTSIANRPYFSSLNPISSLPSVSNNVTVMLAEIDGTTYIPGVKCADNVHSVDPDGDGIYSGSDCDGYKAFRVYNENGNTHVIIDVLGYYKDASASGD